MILKGLVVKLGDQSEQLRVRQLRTGRRQNRMLLAQARPERRCRREAQPALQDFHRVAKAHPLALHHQLNVVPTRATSTQTVPQILGRRDHKARLVVVVERA